MDPAATPKLAAEDIQPAWDKIVNDIEKFSLPILSDDINTPETDVEISKSEKTSSLNERWETEDVQDESPPNVASLSDTSGCRSANSNRMIEVKTPLEILTDICPSIEVTLSPRHQISKERGKFICSVKVEWRECVMRGNSPDTLKEEAAERILESIMLAYFKRATESEGSVAPEFPEEVLENAFTDYANYALLKRLYEKTTPFLPVERQRNISSSAGEENEGLDADYPSCDKTTEENTAHYNPRFPAHNEEHLDENISSFSLSGIGNDITKYVDDVDTTVPYGITSDKSPSNVAAFMLQSLPTKVSKLPKGTVPLPEKCSTAANGHLLPATMLINQKLPGSVFEVIGESGPPHDKDFTVRLLAQGRVYIGVGKSKKLAKDATSRKALADIFDIHY